MKIELREARQRCLDALQPDTETEPDASPQGGRL